MILSATSSAVFAGQYDTIDSVTEPTPVSVSSQNENEKAETTIPENETPLAPGFASASPVVKMTAILILVGVAAFFIVYGIAKSRKLDKEKNYMI